MIKRHVLIFILLLLIVSFFSGCKASYPKEKLVEVSSDLCQRELGRKVDIAVAGQTLYTIMYLNNFIDEKMSVSQETFDIIQNVVLCVNRVSLSTDADIKFFRVIIVDNGTGFQLIFTQYIEDVRRWILGNISRDDFFSRSLTDLNVQPKGYVFDMENLKEITLPDFISQQVVNAVKTKLQKNMVFQLMINVDNIKAVYHVDDKSKYFEYILYKITKDNKILKNTLNKDFPSIIDLINTTHTAVAQKYHFDDFKGIVIRSDDGVELFNSMIKS